MGHQIKGIIEMTPVDPGPEQDRTRTTGLSKMLRQVTMAQAGAVAMILFSVLVWGLRQEHQTDLVKQEVVNLREDIRDLKLVIRSIHFPDINRPPGFR